jgi:hypothetical protein
MSFAMTLMMFQPALVSARSTISLTSAARIDGLEASRREAQFLADFVRLAPKERVEIWRREQDPTGRGLMFRAMDDALVARGVDAVPYLDAVVRSGDRYQSAHAIKVLCDMDRYVPVEQLPLPIGVSTRVETTSDKGLLNLFMIVDGRRIGKEGLDTVMWAANQTGRADLRFHAQQYSGLLEQNLRNQPLPEQLKIWRGAVVKSKGILGADMDSLNTYTLLRGILIEEAPESIPPLIDILGNDHDGFVREEALTVLYMMDACRMRLRGTETGRRAIQAIQAALQKGGLKPVHTTAESRAELWKWLTDRFYNDAVETRFSGWTVIAVALERFYGVPLTNRFQTPLYEGVEAKPIVREFASYLTRVDPYYPSWEYTFVGDPPYQVFNPGFRRKIERYHEQWLRFEASAGRDSKSQP